MTRKVAGRWFVVSACLATLLGSACTPADPPAPPATSSAPTPTENAQEREERLAYAAAETSYREFRAEFYRVLGAGGSKSATTKMKATAAGPYLKYFTELAQAYRGEGVHSTGTERTGYVRPEGYSADSLLLDVCEDSTSVRDFDRQGKQTGKGEIRTARVEVRKIDGVWRVWDGTGKKASSCE
ncbi:hypothetical protein GCM10022197_18960 [Microlunatus spumicola]|uniref:Lipoprotein n=1 Tax=Microlunatus spumicola TaxID=81499 RepID=A0ABP6XBN0_9ACTN